MESGSPRKPRASHSAGRADRAGHSVAAVTGDASLATPPTTESMVLPPTPTVSGHEFSANITTRETVAMHNTATPTRPAGGWAPVRLVGIHGNCAGRVELLYQGIWGTVCDDLWDLPEANIICRQLGCGSAVAALSEAHFGEGSGMILLDNMNCTGQEEHLEECSHLGWLSHNCDHREDASVVCSDAEYSGIMPTDLPLATMDGSVATGETKCGGVITNSSGAIRNPPMNEMHNNITCVWEIKANASSHVRLAFPHLNLDCSNEYFEILDGPPSSTKSLGKSCSGFHISFISTSSSMTLVYFRNFNNIGKPFMAYYYSKANELTTRTPHLITIPTATSTWVTARPAHGRVPCSQRATLTRSLSAGDWPELRLVGGPNRCSGRVEIMHQGAWGTVCDDLWDLNEAEVVCRQLGCGQGMSALGKAHFGEGTGNIFLDNLQCAGMEHFLGQCAHSGWLEHNCGHHEDAGVICSDAEDSVSNGPGDWPEVRLVGGSSQCSGRVEVLHKGAWGTVCDDLWDLNEAKVVCRQLGCGQAVSSPGEAHFGPGSGDIFMDNLQCSGVEQYLGQCAHSGWLNHNCGHHEDAGVICSGAEDLSSHPAGHSEGHLGDPMWSHPDILFPFVSGGSSSCGGVISSPSGSFSSPHYPENYPTDIQCVWEIHVDKKSRIELVIPNLNLEDILGCPYDSVEIFDGPRIASLSMGKFCAPAAVIFFSSSDIMTVVFRSDYMITNTGFYAMFNSISQDGRKSEGTPVLRLVGGSGRCSGRVEVFHQEAWGTVCDHLWDLKEAEVVCRQLGCGHAIAAPGKAYFGPGSGDILLDNIQCSGSEAHFGQCPVSGWSDHSCGHHEDAGVICSEKATCSLKRPHISLLSAPTEGSDSCGGVISSLSGSFSSPWYPTNYPTNMECIWVIRVGEKFHIELTIPSLKLEDIYGCPYDFVEVFDGQPAASLSMGRVCSGAELTFTSSSHVMTVVFKSDAVITNTGFYALFNAIQQDEGPTGMSLRLVNGSHRCEGRVEVSYNGTWGTVCDDSWDLTDATVVCQQLGCGEAVSALTGSHFDGGAGHIMMGDVQCMGNESKVWQCSHRGWLSPNCGHNKDASVICSDESFRCGGLLVNSSGSFSSPWYPKKYPTNVVCAWDIQVDAKAHVKLTFEVVKMENFYGCPYDFIEVFDGPQNDSLSLGRFCSGITPVFTSSSHRMSVVFHSDAIITSLGFYASYESLVQDEKDTDVALRLASGSRPCEGRVELRYSHSWGTVCDDSWDLRDAQVVCQQLGCGGAVAAVGSAHFGRGEGPVALDDVECVGTEARLWQCLHRDWFAHNCGHHEDAGVICSGLVSGTNRCEGRVEVYYANAWGTVCDGNWSIEDAHVVCGQLGCGLALSALPGASFKPGSGSIVLDNVNFTGKGSSLEQCPHSGWLTHDCGHREDAGVIYLPLVRLVAGGSRCEGRVEVQHNGTWGSVCDDLWGVQAAQVVCQQLGCGVALAAPRSSLFGGGSGPIFLDDVRCSGTETNLGQCHHLGLSVHNGGHHEDAGAICSGASSTSAEEKTSSDVSSTSVEEETSSDISAISAEVTSPTDISAISAEVTSPTDSSSSSAEEETSSDVSSASAEENSSTDSPSSSAEEETSPDTSSVSAEETSSSDSSSISTEEDSSSDTSSPSAEATSPTDISSASEEVTSLTATEPVFTKITPSPDLPLRLAGGQDRCEGRLEVRHQGVWGTVCDDRWNIKNARVVCRLLGCGRALGAPGRGHFGPGSGPILMDEVRCSGNEDALDHCAHAGWAHHNCHHNKDAGVVCAGPVQDTLVPSDNAQLSCLPHLFQAVIDRGYLRRLGYSSWDIHLNDKMCRPQVTGRYLIFNIPYGHCGTVKQEQLGSLSYSNSIRGRIHGHPGRIIVRHKVPQVKFTCKVNGPSAVKIGHGDDIQTDDASYDVTISFLQSPTSQDMGGMAPPYANQGKEVFLQATLQSPNPDLRLVVDTCVASPDASDFTTVKYDLIQQGCIKDNTYTNLHSPKKNVAQFKFNAFSFLKGYDVVFVQCTIAVCRARDSSPHCSQRCTGQGRRGAGPLEVTEEQTKYFQMVGPLKIHRAADQTLV
uniref:deleted in malignant brain tumors 1 protein-like n=1 Tax=Jaculus jaculus TaxID=51337 RepID=UPI001E1AF705|nr:deleted in malignant brain tumors 1 protein-like [Jaculus jaculus]